MVKLIIIGKGNHVIKNILPAVERSRKVLVKGFIDKNNTYHCNITGSTSFVDDMFYLDNKETYFYIATPIASHFLLCKNLLQRGLNVICEKLLVEREMEAKELFSLTNGNTHLHEVCMYKYHKAFDYIMQYVVDNKSKIKEISADFKIPALPEGDFRYNKSLGGGAINDIGFYPISFLESLPISDKKIYSTNYFIDSTQNIDTEGSIILLADNVKLIANWALGQEYKNSIRILEDEKVILVERFFSKPFNFDVKVTHYNFSGEIIDESIIGADDQFKNMIEIIGNKELDKHGMDSSLNIIEIIEKVRSSKL